MESATSSNASFNLGMELFGQPQSVVQKSVREKLDEIENELQEVKQLAMSRPWNTSNKGEDQENIAENPALQELKGKTKEELQAEAKLLSKKISFLRQCSLARSLLDESMTLSKPGLAIDPKWIESAQKLAKAEEAIEEADGNDDQYDHDADVFFYCVVFHGRILRPRSPRQHRVRVPRPAVSSCRCCRP